VFLQRNNLSRRCLTKCEICLVFLWFGRKRAQKKGETTRRSI
jgi:hypothetical protein